MRDGVIGVGVIGYGLGGSAFHAPLVQAEPGLRLHAVVTSRAEQVRRDHPGVAVVASAAELLAEEAVELVVVAAPNAVHAELAGAALRAGLQQAPHGQEVGVPAPVVEHAEQPPLGLGQGDQLVGVGGGEGERLVHDHVPPRPQRRRGQLVVHGVGRRHHHQLDRRVLQQLGRRRHHPHPGEVALDPPGAP